MVFIVMLVLMECASSTGSPGNMNDRRGGDEAGIITIICSISITIGFRV